MSAVRRCPDDGRCHHDCSPGECFRVRACAPLSSAYGGGDWPPDVVAVFGGAPSRPCLEDALVADTEEPLP